MARIRGSHDMHIQCGSTTTQCMCSYCILEAVTCPNSRLFHLDSVRRTLVIDLGWRSSLGKQHNEYTLASSCDYSIILRMRCTWRRNVWIILICVCDVLLLCQDGHIAHTYFYIHTLYTHINIHYIFVKIYTTHTGSGPCSPSWSWMINGGMAGMVKSWTIPILWYVHTRKWQILQIGNQNNKFWSGI